MLELKVIGRNETARLDQIRNGAGVGRRLSADRRTGESPQENGEDSNTYGNTPWVGRERPE